MKRDNFILYASYEDKFKMLEDSEQGKLIMALFSFNKGEDVSKTLSPVTRMAYSFITNQMKLDSAKYLQKCVQNQTNGRLGGRPRTKSPENPKPNGFLKNPKKPNGYFENPNDYDNVNDKDNFLIVSQKENIFNNYSAGARARVDSKTEKEREPFKQFYSEVFNSCFTPKFENPAYEIIDTMIEALNQARTPEGLYFCKNKYDAERLINIYCKYDEDNLRRFVCQLAFADEFDKKIENRAIYILSAVIKSAQENSCCKNLEEKIQNFKINLNARVK